ncbi:Vacuolar protein 8 [Bienertia sinuspersici]
MLRSLVRFTTNSSSSLIYDRPIRRISFDVSRNLLRAHTLIRKCRRRINILRRIVNLVTAADFRKVLSLLEASAADLRWLISVFHVDDDGNNRDDVVLSLPPIASNDPILAWVWSYTATLQMGSSLSGQVEAAHEIGVLAQDNDRNKKMIVEEGGVPPLLRLLKEGTSVEGQIAAAVALNNVCNDRESVTTIVDNSGVPLIVQVLSNSSMRVQIKVSELIAKMAEFDDDGFVKEEFGRQNVICHLVTLLSFETFEDEFEVKKKVGSIHSIVEMNKEKSRESLKPRLYSSFSSLSSWSSEGGSSKGGGKARKERENESSEVKKELKITCAKAIWMLAKNSVSNSSRITETKGLLCLAKLIEKHKDDLQKNCIMAIMEITCAAESNPNLRRSAFKSNSPAAKAVVDQLIRVITHSNDPISQLCALRSIGYLSRTFSARDTRVIASFVQQLSNPNQEVATEAAIGLAKFVDPENFLCQKHSKAIIEHNGVVPLLRLLRASDKALVHSLIVLCYLAINVSDDEALEQARVLTALEGADRNLVAQHPQLKELIGKALYNLDLYRGDGHSFRQSSMRI